MATTEEKILYGEMLKEIGRLEDRVLQAYENLETALKNDFLDTEQFQNDFDIANAMAVGAFAMLTMYRQHLGFA